MSHWILDKISEKRIIALKKAEKFQIYKEILNSDSNEDLNVIYDIANALELVVLDLISNKFDDEAKLNAVRKSAADAFRLYRVLKRPTEANENAAYLLKLSALAILGDKGADAVRLLRQQGWSELPITSDDWGKRTWATILDIWLRLIQKKGWEDRDLVLERVAMLRGSQNEFEKKYLMTVYAQNTKAVALELIGLYHLAKIAEILAIFITDGVVNGNYNVLNLIETHFDRIFAVCENARMLELEPLARLLAAASTQMVSNSIWTVTRAVNSRVTQFVRALVDRGRGDKAIFDVLPPQRRALAEKGLLGSSRRAVVVSLPTSSGKTLIAQFRILQALNQFDQDKGWVAYLAPTRTLVNQLTRRLRRDFAPLGINVEQISPALEVDNIEQDLLLDQVNENIFRVLVTTPEKFDLIMRQGWESKIDRPLTLVIVDEAHNIQNYRRGLKLELLLATINNECPMAQFLLLTPFIKNAREVARWLGGQNSDDISLTLDWQPNDRVIGVVKATKTVALNKRSHDYCLTFQSVHTTRQTITVEESFSLNKSVIIADTFAKAKQKSVVAALTAQQLKRRGPVIILHAKPSFVWSFAEKLKNESNLLAEICQDIRLVQDYLKLELGDQFPLIDLLSHGIGIHHAGLSDDVRMLIEWLFENDKLSFLVATTTIAQGVNFPVSGVVLASHQYFGAGFAEDMPAEDFWNIAGRAGRVSQGQLGVIALAAGDDTEVDRLKQFINKQTEDLNSALISLALEANDDMNNLETIVYKYPAWSDFLQYLAHTYRQMGKPDSFFERIEQILRGTLGFEKLRSYNQPLARKLLTGIEAYIQYMQEPNQPIKLVDSTGFSLQSIKTVLANKGDINEHSWHPTSLFSTNNATLQKMMGLLLRVPELRENLSSVTGGRSPDGDKLALIVKDWVNGKSVLSIAEQHFKKENEDMVQAITRCGQNLYGKLAQTVSWGLSALLSITASNMSEEELQKLSNLPAKVFYGVNTDAAISLRLIGIPRTAALPLANYLGENVNQSVPILRKHLADLSENEWNNALGNSGSTYRQIWRILEGLTK